MKVKGVFSSFLIGLLVYPSLAIADDAPSHLDWSGPYAGISISRESVSVTAAEDGIAPTYNSPTSSASGKATGTLTAAYIGHRWQFQNVVLGAEASYGKLNASADFLGLNAIDTRTIFDGKSVASARVTVGAPLGRALVYATGGVSRIAATVGVLDTNALPPSANTMDSRTSINRTGSVIGLGAEYMLSDGWTLGLEYLRYDFGNFTTTGAAGLGGTENWRHSLGNDTVSLKLGIRF